MPNQLEAATGRRYPSPYVGAINARSQYLPEYAQLKEANAYNAESLRLEKERIAREQRFAEQQLTEQEKQSKRSALIGAGNLGFSLWSGNKKNKLLEQSLAGDAAPAGAIAPATKTATTAAPGLFSGATDTSNWVTGAKDLTSLGGGAVAGYFLGDEIGNLLPFGGKKDKEFWGGALAGGAASYILSGGNPYTAVVGAIAGGLTSWKF